MTLLWDTSFHCREWEAVGEGWNTSFHCRESGGVREGWDVETAALVGDFATFIQGDCIYKTVFLNYHNKNVSSLEYSGTFSPALISKP